MTTLRKNHEWKKARAAPGFHQPAVDQAI